jgi:hypothetical protein
MRDCSCGVVFGTLSLSREREKGRKGRGELSELSALAEPRNFREEERYSQMKTSVSVGARGSVIGRRRKGKSKL